MTFSPDFIPLGERAWQRILDHVVAVGDEAETSYLEVKSSIDLASKPGTAKVAKFLLGAANRLPDEARRNFSGFAVLVIGAERGNAPGITRGTEHHELEDRLRPYLGGQFPQSEFGRISVGHDREVVFIIAPPPQDGQTIYPCHKRYPGEDGHDRLDDGAVYVRRSNQTRPANAGDILGLVERARGGHKQPVQLDVRVSGAVSRVNGTSEILERLCDNAERDFVKSLELPDHPSPAAANIPEFLRMRPPSRTEREDYLAAWRLERLNHITRGREYLLGLTLAGTGIRVESRGRFVEKPRIAVTFHDCEAFDFRHEDDADPKEVVEPVVRPTHSLTSNARLLSRISPVHDYPVTWENTGDDVEVVLTPESLRPDTAWSTDQDDYTLVARDPQASSVTVTWQLTEQGSDTITRGELEVPTAETVDAGDLIRRAFPADPI